MTAKKNTWLEMIIVKIWYKWTDMLSILKIPTETIESTENNLY
jgi:hypothetical protein